MPAIGPLAVADGKTTPVTHTFDPVTTNGQTGKWANRSAAFPAAYETLSIEVRPAGSKAGAYRLSVEMVLPTTGLVEGIDAVVREQRIKADIFFSQAGTAADRKDAVALMKNLLSNANVISAAEKLEPFY